MTTTNPSAEPCLTGKELREIADLIDALEGLKTTECAFETFTTVHDSNAEPVGVITNRFEGIHYFYPTLTGDDVTRIA